MCTYATVFIALDMSLRFLSVSLHLGYELSLGDVIPTSLILSTTLLEMARGYRRAAVL